MEKIDRFLALSFGYGSGDGDGDGYGTGYGDGDGDGDGTGYGTGYGSGDGDDDGSGSGSGYGYGLSRYNNQKVYKIDDVETIITSIKGNIAKGFIINKDLTLTDTYIVKIGNYFAHGKTIKEAQRDAENKHFANIDIDIEERIRMFKEKYSENEKIKAFELFDWHNKLTGSCEQGRILFCRDKGINLEFDSFTILEFKDLVNGYYGSDIINKIYF